MGLFNRRELKELRESNAHLLELFKNSQDDLAEQREENKRLQRIVDSNHEHAERMKKRINAMQKIIDAYGEKYGDIRPQKRPARREDRDPYPAE